LSIQDSVIEQLKLEEKLSLANSVGVKYLIGKLAPENLIELTLKASDNKLIELSVEAIEKNVSLLKILTYLFLLGLTSGLHLLLKLRKYLQAWLDKSQEWFMLF